MRLLEQVHEACRTKHYSPRTEQACLRSIERVCRFHPGIRAGRFPADPAYQACLYCPYRPICPRGLKVSWRTSPGDQDSAEIARDVRIWMLEGQAGETKACFIDRPAG